MQLYELENTYQQLMDLELEAEDLQKALDALEIDINEKCENIAKILDTLQAEANAYEEQEKRFKAKKQACNNRYESLKKYMADNLTKMGIDSIKTDLYKISFRKSQSVTIDNIKLIPQEYLKVSVAPNKTELKKLLKTGLEMEGCHLTDNKSIQIK